MGVCSTKVCSSSKKTNLNNLKKNISINKIENSQPANEIREINGNESIEMEISFEESIASFPTQLNSRKDAIQFYLSQDSQSNLQIKKSLQQKPLVKININDGKIKKKHIVDNSFYGDEILRSEIKPNYPFYFQENFYEKLLNDIFYENLKGYEGFENILNDKKSELQLKIYLKTHLNSNNQKINVFRSEFIAPCSAFEYIQIANNIDIQLKLDTYCEKNLILKERNERVKLLYLKYKKTIFTSPRDFVYLKYWNKIEKDGKTYWCDSAQSIDEKEFIVEKDVIRCIISKSGHTIEDLGNKKCLVRIYSENDLKIDIPLFVTRNFTSGEMRKFTEKTVREIREIYK